MKLFFHALHTNQVPFINGGEPVPWAPEISTWASLIVIVLSMAVATIASLISSGRDKKRDAAAAATAAPEVEESPTAPDEER